MEDRQNQNDLGPYESDEIGIGRSIVRTRKPAYSVMRGMMFAALVALLVVGSFWVSFLVGRKILVPVKKLPKMDVPAVKAYSIFPQGGKTEKGPEKKIIKLVLPPVPSQEAVIRPVKRAKKAGKKKVVVTVEPEKKANPVFYKVYAAVEASKDKTADLMKKLGGEGFECYSRQIEGDNWAVQAGAFKDKAKALMLMKDLKAKGFSPKLITQ